MVDSGRLSRLGKRHECERIRVERTPHFLHCAVSIVLAVLCLQPYDDAGVPGTRGHQCFHINFVDPLSPVDSYHMEQALPFGGRGEGGPRGSHPIKIVLYV